VKNEKIMMLLLLCGACFQSNSRDATPAACFLLADVSRLDRPAILYTHGYWQKHVIRDTIPDGV
jgi:hypothetical protein